MKSLKKAEVLEIVRNGGHISLLLDPYRRIPKDSLCVYAENGKWEGYIKHDIAWALVNTGELQCV